MIINKYEGAMQSFSYSKLFRMPMWLFRRLMYLKTSPQKIHTTKMRLGHKIELPTTQNYLKFALINRAYHDDNTFLLRHFIKEGSTVLDIGANIGLYTCAYAQYFENLKLKIHAIEAVDTNYTRLEKNISINSFSNITPYHIAFGKENGELEFNLPSEDFVGNAVGKNVFEDKSNSTITKKVKLVKLDEWAKENNITDCDFIKIDIEGAELFVFEGGKEFISKHRPIIQSEFNKYWVNNLGFTEQDYFDFFMALDYTVAIEQDNTFKVLNDPKAYTVTEGLTDFLFIPSEHSSLKS